MSYELRLSKLSTRDLEDIFLYTKQEWGDKQMLLYKSSLEEGLDLLQQNPHIGHTHPDLSNRHRVYTIKQHIVIYQVEDNVISVSRVLHKKMDVKRHS